MHRKDFDLIRNIPLKFSESQYLFGYQSRVKISLSSSYSSCDLINKMPLVLWIEGMYYRIFVVHFCMFWFLQKKIICRISRHATSVFTSVFPLNIQSIVDIIIPNSVICAYVMIFLEKRVPYLPVVNGTMDVLWISFVVHLECKFVAKLTSACKLLIFGIIAFETLHSLCAVPAISTIISLFNDIKIHHVRKIRRN